MSPIYPTREDIETLLKHMEAGDHAEVFKRVSPNVNWTVMVTHPCAGRYTSLAEFQEATFARLGRIMKEPGIPSMVRNVFGGGDRAWATVELVAVAECNSGLRFDDTYARCIRFDETGTIIEVRACLDSWMVNKAIEENEAPSKRAPIPSLS